MKFGVPVSYIYITASHLQLVSLALVIGEVEEDLLVVLQGLDESESVLQGGHVSLLRGAQPGALLLLSLNKI